jgi:hypothetical protein
MSMRWLRSSLFGVAASGVLTFMAAVPATAGTLYRWKADDGSVSYTDDLKRVPERYRDHVETIATDGLAGYERFTPTDAAATRDYNEKLTARLAALRAWNAQTQPVPPRDPFAAPSAGPSISGIQLQSAPQRRVQDADGNWRWHGSQQTIANPVPTLAFDANPDDPTPVTIERKRVIASGNAATEFVTVVRQGDRVLSVIRSEKTNENSVNWPRLEDLER